MMGNSQAASPAINQRRHLPRAKPVINIHHVTKCELHAIDIRFPASRTIARNQVWAASVFIRGCQDIRYLKVPTTAGAFRNFMSGFEASSSAMRLGTVATRFVPTRLRIAVV